MLVRHYANGVGIDMYPWPGADVVVPDTATLQWESGSFDTITIIAALNHIPNRAAVLNECRRLLRPGGRVVITMLTPRTSRIWHWLRAPWDSDQRDRGMQPGEVYGFTSSSFSTYSERAGFTLLPRVVSCSASTASTSLAWTRPRPRDTPGRDERTRRPRPRVLGPSGAAPAPLALLIALLLSALCPYSPVGRIDVLDTMLTAGPRRMPRRRGTSCWRRHTRAAKPPSRPSYASIRRWCSGSRSTFYKAGQKPRSSHRTSSWRCTRTCHESNRRGTSCSGCDA